MLSNSVRHETLKMKPKKTTKVFVRGIAELSGMYRQNHWVEQLGGNPRNRSRRKTSVRITEDDIVSK